MRTYKFDETKGLGDVVSDKKLTVRTLEFKPDMDEETFLSKLRKCCYVKLGYTCGFYFRSNISEQTFKNFFIVYSPKTKGAMFRQKERGYSCWVTWQYIDSANVEIMSDKDMKTAYDFDMNKFWSSDWFSKSARQMRALVMKNLNEVIKPYIESHFGSDPSLKREAQRYAQTIEEAMQDITKVKNVTIDDEGNKRRSHAKGLETYANREFDKHSDNAQRREDFKKWLASRRRDA